LGTVSPMVRPGMVDAMRLLAPLQGSCSAGRVTGGSLVFVICGMVAASEA
jgi:hypothetical protein